MIIESGLYLLVIQFKRYLSSVTTNVDITAILMISTTKFITFAYCYQDGAYKTEELNYPKEQSLRRIVERPSFWVLYPIYPDCYDRSDFRVLGLCGLYLRKEIICEYS